MANPGFGTKYLVSWSRKWQPTPVFLPGKFHGQRSLVGCSPWGLKESDTTDRLSAHIHLVSRLYTLLPVILVLIWQNRTLVLTSSASSVPAPQSSDGSGENH